MKETVKSIVKSVAATAIGAAVSAVAWKGICTAWCACSSIGSKAANKIVGSGKPNDK